MELRLDRLLADLRLRTEAILEAIDRDPLLVRRESGGLVLANASQLLYTPQSTSSSPRVSSTAARRTGSCPCRWSRSTTSASAT